jgi:predicted TIM-barrel fold metal-dependent hydrolase
MPTDPSHSASGARLTRRHALCCGAAAVAGLFTALAPAPARAYVSNPCRGALPRELARHDVVLQALDGLDPQALWDVHTHLLGTGDSGSGCGINASMTQWWHPVESLRRRVIMDGACVAADAPSIDRAYLQRLQQLAADFPAGARWLLFAFDHALDDAGREQPAWTTFHVPDAYAAQVAAAQPDRFGWVASVHPYRDDALARLDAALARGALAVKWLPSAMNIDLRQPRLRPFYARLAQTRTPLIVHCGEEKAVPGAGRDELGNPLHAREPLAAGVRVIVAHCASLGRARDLDRPGAPEVPAFDLFARLMDEPAWQHLLLGDISALFQVNRPPHAWRQVLQRDDWHARLLHGSDYPLPGVGPLFRPARLVAAGLLDEASVPVLEAVREHNPLLFDLVLKRRLRADGRGLGTRVFDTRRAFVPTAHPQKTVSMKATESGSRGHEVSGN